MKTIHSNSSLSSTWHQSALNWLAWRSLKGPFFKACKNVDADSLQKIWDKLQILSIPDSSKKEWLQTGLLKATQNSQTSTYKMFKHSSMEPQNRDFNIEELNLKALNLLLEWGANPNFMISKKNEQLPLPFLLVSSPNYPGMAGIVQLQPDFRHPWISPNQTLFLKTLIPYLSDENLNTQDKEGNTLLHYLLKGPFSKNTKILVEEMVKKGAFLGLKNKDDKKPIDEMEGFGAYRAHLDILENQQTLYRNIPLSEKSSIKKSRL